MSGAFANKLYKYLAAPLIGNKVNALGKPVSSIKPVNLKIDRRKFREFVGKLDELEKETDEKSLINGLNKFTKETIDYIENGITSGVSVKNGKLLFRQPDNTLMRDSSGIVLYKNGLKDLQSEVTNAMNDAVGASRSGANMDEVMRLTGTYNTAQENVNTFVRINQKIHGASLSPLSEAIPVVSIPTLENYGSTYSLVSEITNAAAEAKKSGAKLDFDVVFLRDQPRSWFPKPATSYINALDQVRIGSNLPGYSFHEFTHAKHNENKLFKGLYDANEHLGTGLLAAYPTALLFGQDIKDAIPGTTDDKVVDAIKNWGPEAYLTSRMAGRGVEELRTYKATKKHLENNYEDPALFGVASPAMMSVPGTSLKNIINAHRWNLASYPIAAGMGYGGMRTAGLMLDKEGSVAKDIVVGPFQDMYYSTKRGVQSLPYAGRILKSMIMSSPSAPPPAWWSTAGKTLIPLGLLYGAHAVVEPYITPKSEAQNLIESTFL